MHKKNLKKKKLISLSNLKKYYLLENIIIWVKYFLKYILILKKNIFIPLSLRFYYYVVTKQMNSNKYYIITSFISCNTYSYSYVITVTVYQTSLYNIRFI